MELRKLWTRQSAGCLTVDAGAHPTGSPRPGPASSPRGPWGCQMLRAPLCLLLAMRTWVATSSQPRCSMTAWTGGFLPRLKCQSWEQWLRADTMASTLESLIPHRAKSSQSWRVAATFSSRTWRTSGLKLVMVTPLRTRPFS